MKIKILIFYSTIYIFHILCMISLITGLSFISFTSCPIFPVNNDLIILGIDRKL